jgi:indolepyruvate ferredoxin oxidoreductase beta subunit
MTLLPRFDTILAGVGGQGIVLAGNIIGTAAMKKGYTLNSFESHGMAQRGGAVVSHLRFGKEVHGSLILEGTADLMIALEPMEAARHVMYMSRDGTIVVNTKPIPSITLSSDPKARYPSMGELNKFLRSVVSKGKVHAFNATELAIEAGNAAALNVVLVGGAFGCGKLPLLKKDLVDAIQEVVPEKFLDLNMRAFELGIKAVRGKK